MRALWQAVDAMKDIIIMALLALSIGLCVWCMYLDNRVHQLEGYIQRIEK